MTQEHCHILFLTPGFPKNEEDTTCLTYFQNYLIHLKKHQPNLQITVLTLHYPFSKKIYQWKGIKVIPLGGANKKHFHKLILWHKSIKIIWAIHQASPVDMIHSLWLKECALIGNYMTRQLKCHHICTAMGTEVFRKENHFLKILGNQGLLNFKSLVNLSTRSVVAVSNFQKEHLKASFPSAAIETIPWGIAPRDDFKLKSYQEREIDVLGVGALIPLKDYASFIMIIKEVVKTKPNLVVKIIGEGPQRQLLEKQIKQHSLEKNIKLMGQLDNHIVQEYMQNSKVFLHTSTFESQGYVFLEALSNGMKIVSRKVGIAQKSDYWYVENDTTDLSTKVSQALEYFEPQKTVLYSINETIEAYCNLYQP